MNKEINVNKCDIDCLIPVDEEDRFSAVDGGYGYRVFVNINESEEWFAQFGLTVLEDFQHGQLEFTVDKAGNLVEDAEALLWISIENDRDGLINDDYANYNEDIPEKLMEMVRNECLNMSRQKEQPSNKESNKEAHHTLESITHIKSGRLEDMVINALEWATDVSEQAVEDLIGAMGITSEELEAFGYHKENYPSMHKATAQNEMERWGFYA